MMSSSPSSGYLEQDSPRKYCYRQYKIPKSDIRGQSDFDSHLKDIQARNELQHNKTGKSQPSIFEIFDVTWEQTPDQLQKKNTPILNSEPNPIQATNNEASVHNTKTTNNKETKLSTRCYILSVQKKI